MPEKADAIIIDYDIVRKREPDILADYRQWMSMQEDRIGTHSEDCHLWPRHDRCMIHRLAAALEKERQVSSQGNLTLSEVEREVLLAVAEDAELRLAEPSPGWRRADQTVRVVRGLLERRDAGCTETGSNSHLMTSQEREAIRYFAQWGTWTAASVHAQALQAYDERTK